MGLTLTFDLAKQREERQRQAEARNMQSILSRAYGSEEQRIPGQDELAHNPHGVTEPDTIIPGYGMLGGEFGEPHSPEAVQGMQTFLATQHEGFLEPMMRNVTSMANQRQAGIDAMERDEQSRLWSLNNMTLADRKNLDLDERKWRHEQSAKSQQRSLDLMKERETVLNALGDDVRAGPASGYYDVLELHGRLRDDIEQNEGKLSPLAASAAIKGFNKAILPMEAVMSDDITSTLEALGMGDGTLRGFENWLLRQVNSQTGLIDDTAARTLFQFYDRMAATAQTRLERMMPTVMARIQNYNRADPENPIEIGDIMPQWRQFESSRFGPADLANPAGDMIEDLQYGFGRGNY